MKGARAPSRVLLRHRLQHRILTRARIAKLFVVIVVIVNGHLIEVIVGILRVAESGRSY
jgi:hypothetical protein